MLFLEERGVKILSYLGCQSLITRKEMANKSKVYVEVEVSAIDGIVFDGVIGLRKLR